MFGKKPPWYAAGLAFECIGCGGCCAGPNEGYVWINRDEIRLAARLLKITPEDFTRRYTRRVGSRISLVEKANADCVFLQSRPEGGQGCSIYSVRPIQCRTWPFWHSNLTGPGAWAAAGTRCPGINRGRLHPQDHIDAEQTRKS